MLEQFTGAFTEVAPYLPYLIPTLAWIWVAKILLAKRVNYNAVNLLEEEDVTAVGIRHGGFLLGVFIGMLGPLYQVNTFTWDHFLELSVEGGLVVGFMLLAAEVMDRLILRDFNVDDEIATNNLAAAFAETGTYLATGLIAFGAFSGNTGPLGLVVAQGAYFFLLGQLALLATAKVLTVFYRSIDLPALVGEGNHAAGLMLGGQLIVVAIIFRACLTGEFAGWMASTIGFATYASIGIGLQIVAQWGLQKLLFSNTDLTTEIGRDSNAGAVGMIVAVRIGISQLIAMTAIL